MPRSLFESEAPAPSMCVGIPNGHGRSGLLPDLRKSTFKSRATIERKPYFERLLFS